LPRYDPHHATPPSPRYAALPHDAAPQAAAAKEKLEADLAASVQLVGKLKKAGGNFKAQLAAATKELEELKAEQAKGQSATELETQLAAAKAAADEGEKKAAALGAELEQARTLQPYAVEAATVCGRDRNRI
jgi:chromosome segregation ATPase